MSSVVADQGSLQIHQDTYSAFVEQIPNIPELSFWLSRQQDDATRPYTLNEEFNSSSWVLRSDSLTILSDADKIEIVKNARQSIREGMQDLDPEIRQLVNQNLKSLIWK